MAAALTPKTRGSNADDADDTGTLISSADVSLHQQLDQQSWYSIQLFALYRLLLGSLLAAGFFWGIAFVDPSSTKQTLFALSCSGFTLLAVIWVLTTRFKYPHYIAQVYAQLTADTILLVLMMHAGGGMNNGIAMLLVVNVVAAGLLLPGMASLVFAAVNTLAVLFEQLYSHLTIGTSTASYTQAGGLSAAFFATAILTMLLSRRVYESEQLASQRSLDIRNLAQLNEHIIQQMQSGVIVVDPTLRIRLINRSARLQLNLHNDVVLQTLASISNELNVRYQLWLNRPAQQPARIRNPGSPFELQPHFMPLGAEGAAGTLIILEDTTPYSRELQHVKLASLGRLTASIAHEIRNPLSAIQHAAQLLEETNTEDARLSRIIQQQTERINSIIENIMQLSRRDAITPEWITLHSCLDDFKNDFCHQQQLPATTFTLSIDPPELQIGFDPSQLHQILTNLAINSMKYGRNNAGDLFITITAGYDNLGHYFLEFTDQGSGISPEESDRIFEPFYSCGEKSAGLGLYIVRELCEFNHAHIDCRNSNMGACFRIEFADPAQLGLIDATN
ncbi:MAG: HAMP domain-containing histidine kinase [Gammaproteobacteria bacterium]|nr:HAMP domain-containing histidine kinase [Gammaproteobacteria bacterium]